MAYLPLSLFFILGVFMAAVAVASYAYGWYWRGRYEQPHIDQMKAELLSAGKALDSAGLRNAATDALLGMRRP